MGLQPGRGSFFTDKISLALVKDSKAILQSDCSRFLTQNVVCQPMQGADAVSQVGDQAALLDHAADAVGKIIHRRVDQGHDQHFLLFPQRAGTDELGRQGREGVGLARAGHGGNAHFPAGVGEDPGLSGAGGEDWHGIFNT